MQNNYNKDWFLNYFYFIQSCICFEHNILGNAKTTNIEIYYIIIAVVNNPKPYLFVIIYF